MKQLLLLLLLFVGLSFPNLNGQETTNANFYNTDTIQEISITFEESNWAYLLDSLRTNGNGLLLGDVTINGTEYKNVGVRYRGSKSFTTGGKRNALYIKMNYINKKQNIDGHKSIKLSNSLRDPSLIREVLAYEIARDYMPAPEANYANVKVNNTIYGVFVNVESVEEDFLQTYYGNTDGAFFKVNSSADKDEPAGCLQNIFGSLEYDKNIKCYLNNFEIISDSGWDELIKLAKTLNETPDKINTILNVDNTLWMLAFNNLLVNLDSYSGQNSTNFYLYQDKNGRFNPVIWDMNLAFGSFKNTGSGSDLSLKELQELDPLLHINNTTKPLISQLLKNETYKKMYLSHLRTILYDWFKSDKYSKRAVELQRLVQVPLINDQNKQYTFTQFQEALNKTTGKRSRIPGIIELMDTRYDYLKKQPSLAVVPADISGTMALGRKQFAKGDIDVFRIIANVDKYPKRVWVKYRYAAGQEYMTEQMYDDGKHNDGTADDGVFGATITPKEMQQDIQYYIQAENASIMSYSPSNYMFMQHKANLEALNK